MTAGDKRPLPRAPYFLGVATVLSPLAFGAVEPWSMALLALSIGIGALLSSKTTVELAGPMRAVAVALALTTALALIQSSCEKPMDLPGTLAPFTSDRWRTFSSLGRLLTYSSALVLCGMAAGEARTKTLLWTVALAGCAVALAGFAQDAAGNRAIYGLRAVRHDIYPFGPFYNRAHAAAFLNLSFFSIAGLAFKVRKDMATTEQVAYRIFLGALCCLIGWAVVATQSRAASFSLVCGAVVLAGLLAVPRAEGRGQRWMGLVALAAAILVLAGLVSLPKWQNLIAAGSQLDESARVRISIYRSSAQLIRDFPIFGIGIGAFASALPSYQSSTLEMFVEFAHSEPLEAIVEAGSIGALTVVLIIWAALSTLVRAVRARSATAICCAVGCCVVLLHAAVDFPFRSPANVLGGLVMLAMAQTGDGRAWTINSRSIVVLASLTILASPLPGLAQRAALLPHVLEAYRRSESAGTEATRAALEGTLSILDRQPAHPQARALAAALLETLHRPEDASGLRKL